VQLIGEGWNFGEVANGARFVQASQLSLNGSGIGTFSDRARDFVRGGGPFRRRRKPDLQPGLHQRPALRPQRQGRGQEPRPT
jgi:pullulanase/glycogen debranching enzyme